ncbi:MAG TPA: HAD hydrolase-like protein [Polyangiales bacterium]|nr:HAD hydrolase-like protein [Polyangiales bacterium]
MSAQTTVIFDLDGTLTDPREGIARSYEHALGQLGLATPSLQELARHIGPPLREVFALLLGTDDVERIEHGVTVYREHFGSVGLFENQPYAGIHAVLAQLRAAGHRLFICTTKADVYAERIVAHFELATYFERVYGPGLDGHPADKAELLARLVERESVDPTAAVMVGDRMHDMHAACKNNMRGVGVLYGFGDAQELPCGRDSGADDVDAAVSCEGEIVANKSGCLQDDAFCYPLGDGRYCTGPQAPQNPPSMKQCGARAGDTCLADEYCAYQAGQYCGQADAQSTCQKRPSSCAGPSAPVCGCDQNTYPSACEANKAGSGIFAAEACK